MFVVNNAVDKAVREEIESEYQALYRYQENFKIVSVADAIDYRIYSMKQNTMIYLLVRSDGSKVVGNLSSWPLTVPKSNGWYYFKVNGKEDALAKVIIYDKVFPILVGRTLSVYTTLKQEFIPVMIAIIFSLASILSFIVFRSSRHFSHRVECMNRVLSKVQNGQIYERIISDEIAKEDELAVLASHINTALNENTRLMVGLESVSQTAAHEINKELSRLRDLAEEKNQLELQNSANALLRLLTEILELSKIESSTDVGMAKLDLKKIAFKAAQLYQDAFDEAGVELLTPTQSALVLGQSHLLVNAVANLLNNALKYTNAGGTVKISISHTEAFLTLTVSDTGIGTESDDLAETIQQAQKGKVAGYGFGLRFVQAVSIRHGAKLKIKNTNPGFEVSITFPILDISY